MAKDEQYRRGYAAGYADGVRDTMESRVKSMESSKIGTLPVQGMIISQRAINCLVLAGCINVADVAGLSEETISRMRNLGKKTAQEIAQWMIDQGILDSPWSAYL